MSHSRTRRIVGDILIGLTLIFTVYLSAVMINRINNVVLKDVYVRAFFAELVICLAFLVLAIDIRTGFLTGFKKTPLKVAGRILRYVLAVIAILILFLAGKVITGCLIDTSGCADNVIVLGMALHDGKPTDDLILRVDTAAAYHDEYPDATLILTGGNPDKVTGKTEAYVMKELLTERGVPEDKMITEDISSSTKENFDHVASLISTDERIVVISSNYHMDRVVKTAKSAGFANVLRKPAPSSFLSFGANVMWEVLQGIVNIIPR